MSLADVKALAKEHRIKGVSHLGKKELVARLIELNISVPATPPRKRKTVEERKMEDLRTADPKFERLKTIRKSPRAVKITDVTTGDVQEFGSMFSAGKYLGHSSKIITDYDGKVYKGSHKIEIVSKAKTFERDSTMNNDDTTKRTLDTRHD